MPSKMEAEPSFSDRSLTREKLSVVDLRPYLKLRLGGSRSSVVSSKFLRDVVTYNPESWSISSGQHTRSVDTQSIASHSTTSSASQEKVRIVGRGGVGARRRNHSKEYIIVPAPTPPAEIESSKVPQDAPVLRTVGRGGLGSRPKTVRAKKKIGPTSRDPSSFELLDIRTISKRQRPPLPFDMDLNPQSSEQSLLSPFSRFRFVGDDESPHRDPKRSPLDDPNDVDLDGFGLKRSSSFGGFHKRPSPTTLPKGGARTKTQLRERRFPVLFSLFHNDSATRKGDLTPTMSNLPSQLTLTSIETDPSYFFHGSGSRPSTPTCDQETDSTAISSSSIRLSSSPPSFQQGLSPSTISIARQAEIEDVAADCCQPRDETSSTIQRKDIGPLTRRALAMKFSTSEAITLGRSPELDTPFERPVVVDENLSLNKCPSMLEKEGVISTAARRQSWTGEWNVGMADVIRALRDLR